MQRTLRVITLFVVVSLLTQAGLWADDRYITLTENSDGTLTISGANASDWLTPTVRPEGESWALDEKDSFFNLKNEGAWLEPDGSGLYNTLQKSVFLNEFYITSETAGPIPTGEDFLTGTNGAELAFGYQDDAQTGTYHITFFDNGDKPTTSTVPEPASVSLLFVGGAFLLGFLRKHRSAQV